MPLRKAVPYRHPAVGVSDALDGAQVFEGAMASLSNLVPDPTTKNLWVPRPAAMDLTTFSGFTMPGFISAQVTIGTFVYGMIASNRNPGHDEPFCFDLNGNTFIAISGVSAGNVPVSPNSSGAWTPPTMALIGVKLTVTHPGFDGITNFVGWLDITNPAAPAWSAGNTAGNALPYKPAWVAQFYQRAYYGVNPPTGQPAAIATDVLDPTTRTNATYVVTFGDNVPLTAAAGLPLSNALGGVFQALIVFKGVANMFQITGDFVDTNNPIALNALNVATGTFAPNSLCETPLGLMFISPEGMRVIDFSAKVSEPIGAAGAGIVAPFSTSVVPSRICAACNATVIRVTTQNGTALGTPQQEWWYDLPRKVWSGPHSFPASLISVYNNTFIVSPIGVFATLFQSDPAPNSLSGYTENEVVLSWAYSTALLPPRKDMNECVMNESFVYIGFAPASAPMTAFAADENGTVLELVTLPSTGSATIWGAFNWGEAPWLGVASAMAARSLEWSAPVEFDRMSITVQGLSADGVRLGDTYLRYQPLGYIAGP